MQWHKYKLKYWNCRTIYHSFKKYRFGREKYEFDCEKIILGRKNHWFGFKKIQNWFDWWNCEFRTFRKSTNLIRKSSKLVENTNLVEKNATFIVRKKSLLAKNTNLFGKILIGSRGGRFKLMRKKYKFGWEKYKFGLESYEFD